jgi:pyruvate formate lyase activating enzyme
MSIKDVLDRIRENRRHIRGITCSGGECTLFAEFMTELFPLVKKLGLGCFIDTNGSADFEEHPELLACCDGVALDIKALDPEKHRLLTGADNRAIIQNAVFLAGMGKLVEIRTVITSADYGAFETVNGVTRLLKPWLRKRDIRYRLIPFRVYGVRKEYRGLGAPSRDFLEDLRKLALNNGFKTVDIT